MSREAEAPDIDVDLLVIGSGAAGLSAALTAAAQGARALILEKSDLIGGTTCHSEAMIWVPCSRQARDAGISDSADAATAYIESVAGHRFDRERVAAYVAAAPHMLAFIEAQSRVRYELAKGSLDYYPAKPGATRGARALCPTTFDGRLLGADLRRLRPPLKSMRILGGMSVSGADLPHFFRVGRSLRSTLRVAHLVARYGRDRLCGWPRGTSLANGEGVVAGLWHAFRQRGGQVLTGAPALRLISDRGRISGAVFQCGGGHRNARAKHGVILATGGFSASQAHRQRYASGLEGGAGHLRLVAEGATGDGLDMALSMGAAIDDDLDQPFAWAPASFVPQSGASFPHFIERAKPGIIAVGPDGKRLANEAMTYHDFVPAVLRACQGTGDNAAWLIADHRAQRRFSLGASPPAPGLLGPHLNSGYLIAAPTIQDLAKRIGVDPVALEDTIARFNNDARQGSDSAYGRGESMFDQAYGDPDQRPNPCLGALDQPPFYAVKLQPSDLGSFVGLSTNANAQVQDINGDPIAGLYAAGLDAASAMGGHYPAAGVTVGAAMTFGYIAARHALGVNE